MSALHNTLPEYRAVLVSRRRVAELLSQGWRLLDEPADPEEPALMSGPVEAERGDWRSLGSIISGIVGANDA